MNSISLYKSIAKKYEAAFKGENNFLNIFIKDLPKKAVILELGCGTGEDTKYLINKGFDVVSIDNSNEMLKIAKQKIPEQRFITRYMRSLSYTKGSFDGIVSAFSLIHLKKREVTSLVKKFSIKDQI